VARPLDADVSRRILDATVELLSEVGYSAVTIDAVAARADVGRPAVYRRYKNKADLCVAAIGSLLPPRLESAGDTHEERLRGLFMALGQPSLARYVGLVGELLGLQPTEPALAQAWRESVYAPRRQAGLGIIREARDAGVLRRELDDEFVIDSLTGQLLARVWRGLPLDDDWREETWRQLWAAIAEP
jgi:AcrR family transcriptional regulator